MTDFLSRLVERSSGRAAVAHPVVAPLFAAGPPLPAESAEGESWGEGPAAGEQPAPSADRARASRDPREGPASREEPALPASALPEPAPGARPPHVPSPGPIRSRAVAVEGRITEGRNTETAAAAQDGRPPAAAAPAAPGSRRGPAPEQAPLVPLQPREALSFARNTSAPPDAAGAAPIVRISIGRIDVRAVTPARPAPPPAPPARREEAVSLEEYLRPRRR